MGQMIPEHVFRQMLPRAAAWAQGQEEFILRDPAAIGLTPQTQDIARRAGVRHSDAVRVLAVPGIPLPEEVDLREAAGAFRLITPRTAGLTIGHGIFVRQDCLKDAKLISHELMHVAQYERLGSILAFLQQYLSEVNEHGYPEAPMEQEAIAFAEIVFPTRK
jgi:hypothetical protein